MNKLILVILAAFSCFALPSCNTTNGDAVPGLVANYAATRYLSTAKTGADWNKRHQQITAAVTAIEALNEKGLSAASLAALAGQFTNNPDVAFVISLVAVYATPSGNNPNNPLVKRIKDGVRLALAAPSPFPAI